MSRICNKMASRSCRESRSSSVVTAGLIEMLVLLQPCRGTNHLPFFIPYLAFLCISLKSFQMVMAATPQTPLRSSSPGAGWEPHSHPEIWSTERPSSSFSGGPPARSTGVALTGRLDRSLAADAFGPFETPKASAKGEWIPAVKTNGFHG